MHMKTILPILLLFIFWTNSEAQATLSWSRDFEVELNISTKELLVRFEKNNKDADIESLKSFSKDEYVRVLKNHKSKNKQAIALFLSM